MALDEEKLKKFLLVALSTDQPGEAHAALSQVNKLLKKAGKDIHWLADRLASGAQPAREIYPQANPYPQPSYSTMPGWRMMMLRCAEYPERLRNERELEFILSLLRQSERSGFYPSDRQMSWLEAIYARVSS